MTSVRWLHACDEMQRHEDGSITLVRVQDRFAPGVYPVPVGFWAVALVERAVSAELVYRFALRGRGMDLHGPEGRLLVPPGDILLEAPVGFTVSGPGSFYLALDVDGVELARTPIHLLDPDTPPAPIS